MDYHQVLAEVDTWPLEDRLRLAREILGQIEPEVPDFELTEAVRAELDRRLAAHRADPGAAIPWEQVEAEALARLRK